MKALWAFEPFHQEKAQVKIMYGLLKQFARATNPQIFITIELLHQKAKVKIPVKNIHVVDFETFSTTKAVDRLLSLTKSRGSDLLALYTHAHHGFIRSTMGSFAETAIHRSKVSLLLLNPKTTFSQKIKRIFFASDFSPSAKKQFKKVMQICKQLKSDLIVFHHAEVIYKWSLDESNPEIHAYRRNVKQKQSWIEQECKRVGIVSKVIVASGFADTTNLILKHANKEKADLIVVSARTGPFAALMGGSITRQVVRSSAKPVLILK